MNENLEIIENEGIEVVENEIVPTEDEFEVEEGGSGKLLLAGGLLASAIVGGAVVAYKKIKAKKNGKSKTKKKLMFVEVDEDGNIIPKNSKEDSDNESEN